MRSNFFQRVPRRKEEPGGWGDIWRLNPEIRTQLKDSPPRSAIVQHGKESTVAVSTTSSTKVKKSDNTQTTALHGSSPSCDGWSNLHNSTSSSSPSSVDLYTPTSNEHSERAHSSIAPSFGLFNFAAEDVSLLENSIDTCVSIIDHPIPQRTLIAKSVLSIENTHTAKFEIDTKPLKKEPGTRDQKTKKSAEWWSDELTDSVTTLIDNLSNSTYEDRYNIAPRGLRTPTSFIENPLISASEPITLISDELPWVDDRLNLEELDSLLGLN